MAEFDGINVPEGIASILLKDREMTKEFNTDSNFPVTVGTALILYNAKGEGTVVEGESQILDAIRKGFIYTKDTVSDMAPSKDFEDKIYRSRFFSRLPENLQAAMEQTKMEEKSRQLNPNYSDIMGSSSGYQFSLIPGYYEKKFGMGPPDVLRSYNPERDEMLPKPKPTTAEILMAEEGE
tara:strand:- start:1177 stop:1716 length:540 start_codon:yes stop_codon:yes gene_type:complete